MRRAAPLLLAGSLFLTTPLFLGPSAALAASDGGSTVVCRPVAPSSSVYVCGSETSAVQTSPIPPGTTTTVPSGPLTTSTSSMPACGWWAPCVGTSSSGGGTSSDTGSTGIGSGGASLTGQAAQFLSMVNAYRAQMGKGSLESNATLDALALEKAQDMVRLGYVAHVSPDLGSPFQMEIQAGYQAQSMGAENIAEAGSIERALINLESDPGHQANLLDSAFTQTGIAVLPIPYGVLVEELFSGPVM